MTPGKKDGSGQKGLATAHEMAVDEKHEPIPEGIPPPRKGDELKPVIGLPGPPGQHHLDHAVAGPPKKRPPADIVVYHDWCKACGICIEFCPTRVYERGKGGYPLIAHPEKCISCELCELLCPDFAIELALPVENGQEGSDPAANGPPSSGSDSAGKEG